MALKECLASGLVFGQAMVGLPQYGVTLEGNPWDPVVVNHSGKNIIGWVIQLTGDHGESYATHQALFPNGKPLPPGGQMEMFATSTGKIGIAIPERALAFQENQNSLTQK